MPLSMKDIMRLDKKANDKLSENLKTLHDIHDSFRICDQDKLAKKVSRDL